MTIDAGVTVTEPMVGAVRSTLTVAEAEAELPARSDACRVITRLAPLVDTPTELGQLTTPETGSEHVNVTVTAVLFQPAAFGAGVTVAVIVGAVVSIDTVAVAVAVLPAVSVAVPVTCWPAPSVDTTTGAGHTANLEPVHVNVTVTAVLFHPAAFGAGLAVAVIVSGSVLPNDTDTVTEADAEFPATSTAVPVTS